jgi:hypothetical protein
VAIPLPLLLVLDQSLNIENNGGDSKMAIKTDVAQMQVGDEIICEYVATGQIGSFYSLGTSNKNLLPSVPSGNSANGTFYFRMVDTDLKGRKILVADRNIQGGVTWDEINKAGFAEGDGAEIKFSLIPTLTSDTSASSSTGIAFASSTNTANPAYAAFDGKDGTKWSSNSGEPLPQWLGFQFNTPLVVNSYAIRMSSSTGAPKTWKFQGSHDGVVWVDLHEVISDNGFINYIDKEFKFNNHESFRMYRIYILDKQNPSDSYVSIAKLHLYNNDGNIKYKIRLLTGGISSTDTDNEWDKYIVNSTLNGTITPGDDSVWNWKANSWTSTRPASNSDYSVFRGNSNSVSFWGTLNGGSASLGFRPVLIVDIQPKIRYLIKDGNDIKTIRNGQLVNIGQAPVTDTMFENFGIVYKNEIDSSIINATTSSKPEVLYWSDKQLLNKKAAIIGKSSVKFRYKAEITNPPTLLKDWSSFTGQDVVDTVIVPSSLITTANPYFFKVTVEQSNGVVTEGINTITLYDTEPTLIATIQGLKVNLTIGDNENNSVQYYIKLNNKQIYPASGLTPLLPTPVNTTFVLNQDDILIGQNNILEIFAQDQYGKSSSVTLTFIGDYNGIVFMDEQGNYYSNHIGDILQYLDFGVVVAGQVTLPKKVRVVNKNGDPIKNLTLTVDDSMILTNTKIEISKTDNPFIPEDIITFSNVLDYDDEVPVYVRVITDKNDNPHSGTFEIHASADLA